MTSNLKVEVRQPWWKWLVYAYAWTWKRFAGYTRGGISRLQEMLVNNSTLYIEDVEVTNLWAWKVSKAIDDELKCLDCDKRAVTFHGIATITHGYCEEHRCCARCGGKINPGSKCQCYCKGGPTERMDYMVWKEHGPWLSLGDMRAASDETNRTMLELKDAIDKWAARQKAEANK